LCDAPTCSIHIKLDVGQKNIASPHLKEGDTVLFERIFPCAEKLLLVFKRIVFLLRVRSIIILQNWCSNLGQIRLLRLSEATVIAIHFEDLAIEQRPNMA
jgi:hypothetical protein